MGARPTAFQMDNGPEARSALLAREVVTCAAILALAAALTLLLHRV